jgi:hypothetical protein
MNINIRRVKSDPSTWRDYPSDCANCARPMNCLYPQKDGEFFCSTCHYATQRRAK